MLRARTLGLALVAVFAFSAVVVASASAALPELVGKPECKKQATKTFEFTEAKCETKSAKKEGEFELEGKELVKKNFVGVSGEGKLENTKKEVVTCKEDTSLGETMGPKKVIKVKVVFKGCKATSFGNVACKTPEAEKEEIRTKELEGEIGYIKSIEPKEVGLDLWPASRTAKEKEKHEFEALFVEFECTGLAKFKVKGSIIAKVEPINTKTKTLKLVYTQAGGKQTFTKLEGVEGGAKDVLMSSLDGGEFTEAGEQTTDTTTYEEEVALKA